MQPFPSSGSFHNGCSGNKTYHLPFELRKVQVPKFPTLEVHSDETILGHVHVC